MGVVPKLTRIYTKKGDDGTTGLGGGQRVAKDTARVAAFGVVDELNSALGLALALGLTDRTRSMVVSIQNELFHLGSDLCFLEADKPASIPQIELRHVERLEAFIDEANDVLGPLENFILPGGAPSAAALHVARSTCRRAEREVTALARQEPIGRHTLRYLNRLSDALFVIARLENHEHGVSEPLWDPRL